MSIALSLVIEYIYHTEEDSVHNNIRLSMTRDDSRLRTNSQHSMSGVAISYPLWKKILLITLAVAFSVVVGISRFIIGAHSLD